jgi:hypothetical protein
MEGILFLEVSLSGWEGVILCPVDILEVVGQGGVRVKEFRVTLENNGNNGGDIILGSFLIRVGRCHTLSGGYLRGGRPR